MLLKIRGRKLLKEDKTFHSVFYDILSYYERKREKVTKERILPNNSNKEKIEAFVKYINQKAIKVITNKSYNDRNTK